MPNEQIKVEQYKQAREDHRHFDQLIWATPTVVVTISGAILGISYNFLKGQCDLLIIRALLLVVLAGWIFTLLVALSKFRFFQVGRTDFFQQLERDALLKVTPMKTDDQETKPKSRLERRTAYNWLRLSVFLTFLLIVGTIIHTLWQVFN